MFLQAVAGLAADGRQIVTRAKSEATNYEKFVLWLSCFFFLHFLCVYLYISYDSRLISSQKRKKRGSFQNQLNSQLMRSVFGHDEYVPMHCCTKDVNICILYFFNSNRLLLSNAPQYVTLCLFHH